MTSSMAFKISSIGQLLKALMFNINIYLATIAGAIKQSSKECSQKCQKYPAIRFAVLKIISLVFRTLSQLQ